MAQRKPFDPKEVHFFEPSPYIGVPTILLRDASGLRIFVDDNGWKELRRIESKGLTPVDLTDEQWKWFQDLVKRRLGKDLPKPAKEESPYNKRGIVFLD